MSRSPSLYSPRFLLILGLQFTFGLGYSSFLLLPKYLAEVHAADASAIGRIMAAAPAAAVLVMPLLAAYVDRVSRHRLMLAAAVVSMVTSLAFAVLAELGIAIYALRLLQGAAFTSFMTSGSTLVVELAPKERLGQALGLSGASNLVTNAIGPAVAESLALGAGWRAVFVLSAACALLAMIGTSSLREPRRAAAKVGGSPRLWGRQRIALFYTALVSGLGFATVTTFYQPLAIALGITHVRGLFIGYTAAALGVRVVFGSWLDRVDRRRLVMVAAALYGLVVFATAELRPGWLLPIGVALGLAQGTLYPVGTALLFESAELEQRGALLSYFNGAFNIGVVLATLGFGALAGSMGYRFVFVVAGALTFSAWPVLARGLPRARSSAPPANVPLSSSP